VLSVAAVALAVAGLVAGFTGTWSPCGFSMIDTLGPRGHAHGRRTTIWACVAFALGAPLGGMVTFGGLSAVGALLQGGGAALGVAAAIAVVAAALDLAGVRIAPQLRRQVPEGWRRVLPLPLAGFLYGILLGLGFTTYVLSFALPALAAISVAAADVKLGLVLGVAFGVGRALPIVVLAPLADRPFGGRAITAMAERPMLLRGTRVVDALALGGVAAAFFAAPAQAAAGSAATAPHGVAGSAATAPSGVAGSAATAPSGVAGSAATAPSGVAGSAATAPSGGVAAEADFGVIAPGSAAGSVAATSGPVGVAARDAQVARPGTGPSADAGALAWSVPGGNGFVEGVGVAAADAGGKFPALGDGRLAVIGADGVPVVVDRASGASTPVPAAAGADALAVSSRWLAWRLPKPDRLFVLDLSVPGATPRTIVTSRGVGTLSRPSLSGDRLVWGSATTAGSVIRALDLALPGARAQTLRRSGNKTLVAAPAISGSALVWLFTTPLRQEVRIGVARPARATSGRVLMRLGGVAGRDGGKDPGYTYQGVRPEDRHGPVTAARFRLLDTALDTNAAYVSRVPSRGGAPSVVRLSR
jgi:hypothetical protein